MIMVGNRTEAEVKIDEQFIDVVEVDEVQRRVVRTLAAVAPNEPVALTVVITSDATIQNLNREHLGIDAPTDVLAFSQVEGTSLPDTGAGPRYLGDVIVSYERAVAQADQYNEPIERELHRLVIHGTLHLLGYDDQQPADRNRMWKLQEDILSGKQ